MSFHRSVLQFWAVTSIAWFGCAGVLAGSGYMEAQMRDAVRLEQQAKDIRAAGYDPSSVTLGGAIQLGAFTVPPVELDAPGFWQRETSYYAGLGASFPVGSLLVIEGLAGLAAGARRRRRADCGGRLVFPRVAGSFDGCSPVPVSASRHSSR